MSFGIEVVGDDAQVTNLLTAGDFASGDLQFTGDDGEIPIFGDDTGGVELIGDDGLVEIGAASSALARLARGNPMFAQLAKLTQNAQKKVANARQAKALAVRSRQVMAIRPQQITTKGGSPFGCNSLIAAGATASIPMTPPVAFHPQRLLIGSNLAPNFVLESVQIGQTEYLIGGEPVTCVCFNEQSINQGWNLPTVQIGQTMLMRVTNVGGADATFRAAWLGKWAG